MRTLSERSTACCLLLLAALWLAAAEATALADPGQEPAPHTPFELPFEVTDAVFDAQRGMLYASSLANRRIYFVDLATGRVVREFGFDWMPERLTLSPDGSRLFVALLTRAHDTYWFGENEGYIASFDLALQVKDREFRISEDPFDLAATAHGQIVVSSGSGQWGHLRTFDAATGALLSSVSSVYEGVNVALHPSGSAVYATNNLCQASLERFDVSTSGVLTRPGVGFPLRTYCGIGDVFVSPLGDALVSWAGDVVTAAGGGADDLLPLAELLPSYVEAVAFDPERNTLFTGNGPSLGYHNLTSFEPIGTAAIGGEIAFLGVEGLRVLALLREPNETRLVEIPHPAPQGGSDTRPLASVEIAPAAGHTTLTGITFDASDSTDLEGPVRFRWDVGDDGVWDTEYSDDPTLVRRFSTAGSREIRLRVKDTLGNIDERVVSVDVAFAADPGEAGEAHPSFVLPFVASHAVFDPVRPYVYVSSKERRALFFVSIATGLIERTFHFDEMPERMVLTPDGAQLYVTLLTREHSPYWYDGEQEGSIARFDLDRQHKDRQFHVSIDPFDLAATTDGALVVTSGSGQWTDIAVFDGDSGEPRGAPVHGIRELTTLELHPSEQRLYAAGGTGYPQDLHRWHFGPGGGVEHAWDSIYHGEHWVGDDLWVSPYGDALVTAGGDVFSTEGISRSTDLLYVRSTGASGLRDLVWNLARNEWAAVDDYRVLVHDMTDHRELERFTLRGTGRAIGFRGALVYALQLLGNQSVIDVFVRENRAPATGIAEVQPVECTGPLGAAVALQASDPRDPDSVPGLFEDIARYQWFRLDLVVGALIPLGTGPSLTAPFALGSHQVLLRVTDHGGMTGTAQVEVQVVDTTPPELTVAAQPPVLSPASGKAVPVALGVAASDPCGGAVAVSLTGATSNASGHDDGIKNAKLGTDDRLVRLRAKTSRRAPPRFYTLCYSGRDERGNEAFAEVTIPVAAASP